MTREERNKAILKLDYEFLIKNEKDEQIRNKIIEYYFDYIREEKSNEYRV